MQALSLLVKGTTQDAIAAATSYGLELRDVVETKCKDNSFFVKAVVDEACRDAVLKWFAAASHLSMLGYAPGELLWYSPQREPDSEPVLDSLPIAMGAGCLVFFTSEPVALLLMGLVLFAAAFLARHIRDARQEGSLRSARWHFRHALAAQPKRAPLIPPPLHPAQIEYLRRVREVETGSRWHP